MRFDASSSASLVLSVEFLQLHQMVVALDRRFLVALEELGGALRELPGQASFMRNS